MVGFNYDLLACGLRRLSPYGWAPRFSIFQRFTGLSNSGTCRPVRCLGFEIPAIDSHVVFQRMGNGGQVRRSCLVSQLTSWSVLPEVGIGLALEKTYPCVPFSLLPLRQGKVNILDPPKKQLQNSRFLEAPLSFGSWVRGIHLKLRPVRLRSEQPLVW